MLLNYFGGLYFFYLPKKKVDSKVYTLQSGAKKNMATRRHDAYIRLQNYTCATLERDTTYNSNNI
jgi:hypothetical protein